MRSEKQSGQMAAVTRQTFDEVMVPTYAPSAFIPVRGAGLELWDSNGRRYLDLTAGIAVCSLGHCHPAIVKTLQEQAGQLWHVSNYFTTEPALKLAKMLTDVTFADRAFFCNSGGEANEAALKLARRWAHDRYGPEKNRIISFNHSFHGRTLFTVTAGGQPKYSEGFGPLPGAIDHANFNDIDSVRALMGPDVCAIIVEPVQGEGGVVPSAPGFLKALRQLCDENNALLVYDEIQSGMGRTGSLFAYMAYDVVPDILTSAKALGNGFPIATMLTTEDIASVFTVGVHGTTYGGNPLATSVACKVMEIINDEAFLAKVKGSSHQLRSMLETIVADYPEVFSEVRGKGMMLGLVMAERYLGRAREITAAAEQNGLLLLLAGLDVIRFVPPLVLEAHHIEEADRLLRSSIDSWRQIA